MDHMRNVVALAVLSTALISLSGCSTLDRLLKGNPSAAIEPETTGPLAPSVVNNAEEINRPADRACAPAALTALAARLPEASQQTAVTQSVFTFATDKHDLNSEISGVLAAHALLLQQNQRVQMKITGHTDERGTADYNLALGERRANAVATFLAAAGVTPTQLQVVSYGEEKPAALGSDESAWAQNRRVELAYSGCE